MQPKNAFMQLFSRISIVSGAFAILALLGTPAAYASASTSAQPSATPAYIRIIHASPAVGTADVFVDGNVLLSSFAFGSVTGYVPLPAGPHKVQIALVGKGIGGSSLTQTLVVQAGVVYTAAAIGSQATGLSIEVFIDNNILSPGKAKTRIYNLSPDSGPFNVSAGGNDLVNQVSYQQASNYLTLSTGSYNFSLSAPSTNTTLPLALSLAQNTVTSIFAVGMVNASPKVEVVPAQVNGIPGVPSTGSDPGTRSVDFVQPQTFTPWMVSIMVIAFLVAGIIFRRRAAALQ